MAAAGPDAIVHALGDLATAANSGPLQLVVDAEARLARSSIDQLVAVQDGAVRTLLEELHPDGVDGDDLRTILRRCVAATTPWWPDVDPTMLAIVLTGALGVHDGDQPARPTALTIRHASVVLADLTRRAGRPVGLYLDSALAEIRRAETMELP